MNITLGELGELDVPHWRLVNSSLDEAHTGYLWMSHFVNWVSFVSASLEIGDIIPRCFVAVAQ